MFSRWIAFSLLVSPMLVGAKTFSTMDKALAAAFPGAEIKRSSKVLTDDQKRDIEKESGTKLSSALVYPYQAFKAGELVGTAYFDVHRVRTLPETLMILITPDHKIKRVEILSFKEPEEYIPSDKWYAQLESKKLDSSLALKRAIRPMTGATLTARATVQASRRVLAIHKRLFPPAS